MEYRTLGRTGLRVSVCGLGGGGTSQLGWEWGSSIEQAVSVVRRGFDLGINYFDSSELYRTESIFGVALEGHRDEVILSSKVRPFFGDGSPYSKSGIRESVEASLRNFRTEYIDVYHMHHLTTRNYQFCLHTVIPELLAMQKEGKIRFLAASEHTSLDPMHLALGQAVECDHFDVFMVAYNLFNQSARECLLPRASERNLGVEIMIAARNQFSKADRLAADILRLADAAAIDPARVDRDNPLGFILDDHRVASVAEMSYRLAAQQEGAHVVLVGTGSITHLEENVRALNAGPLPPDLHEQLRSLFGHLALTTERVA